MGKLGMEPGLSKKGARLRFSRNGYAGSEMQKILTEIRSAGLRDWLWFVVWLRRDVFSDRLRLSRYWPNRLDELRRDRRCAAVIEAKLKHANGDGGIENDRFYHVPHIAGRRPRTPIVS